jgi:hypothetical protein
MVMGCALAVTTACQSFHPVVGIAPKDALGNEVHSFVQLQMANGSEVKLRSARVLGDSVVGELLSVGHERLALGLNEIRQVELGSFSPGKTLGAIMLYPIVVIAIAAVAMCVDSNGC